MDCIFCKIVQGLLPAKFIYQDESIVAFDDISPKAPVHKLLVPKQHIATVNELDLDDKELIAHMVFTAKDLAKKFEIAEGGYKLIFNCNQDGGQIVYHLHLHLMGGRQLK